MSQNVFHIKPYYLLLNAPAIVSYSSVNIRCILRMFVLQTNISSLNMLIHYHFEVGTEFFLYFNKNYLSMFIFNKKQTSHGTFSKPTGRRNLTKALLHVLLTKGERALEELGMKAFHLLRAGCWKAPAFFQKIQKPHQNIPKPIENPKKLQNAPTNWIGWVKRVDSFFFHHLLLKVCVCFFLKWHV